MSKRIVRRVLYIVAVIVLLIIIAGASAVIWYKSSLSAIIGVKCSDNCEVIKFTVPEGSGASSIADSLEKAGVIKSALAFKIYLNLEADNKKIMPGEYEFKKDMSVKDIVKQLNEGVSAKVFRITFLPGETIATSKKRLLEVGYTQGQIDEAFNKTYSHPLLASKPADASLEGYIWGDTYEFYQTATVDEILTRLFDEMWKNVQKYNLVEGYKKQGLTLHEGITLASVIQRESTADYQERRHVAQVFLLRLKTNTPLGSDAIIAYEADLVNPNRSKTDMSYLTKFGCPWNSRQCKGLPPTPIAAPSVDSMRAAADPTDTKDYYFLTGDDGKMYYAKTEAGHNANIKKYCKKLCLYL
ncbi:endolytic transglycosylase MltG [Candidatus Saccharibacteria bacterium]|nr:endolytic transglycosylase MltG [Candidatus Saccharibacteria bacterium]